jgi:hypothetical protein
MIFIYFSVFLFWVYSSIHIYFFGYIWHMIYYVTFLFDFPKKKKKKKETFELAAILGHLNRKVHLGFNRVSFGV